MDSVNLAQKLISFPSVTPGDHGIFNYMKSLLDKANFNCQILEFGSSTSKVTNLYAQYGIKGPNLCFAGHLDVVPPGDISSWTHNPFSGVIENGKLFGRGASDMKSAVAAWTSAALQAISHGKVHGSVSLLLTGDEEGVAINGTVKVLQHLINNDVKIDACVVGEPTCELQLGDTVKIGRRGSITYKLEVCGTQGHVAYPDLAKNPINSLIAILHKLKNTRLDSGNEHFQASNLEITSIDVGNPVTNIIPAKAHATFNIRYNNEQSEKQLTTLVDNICKEHTDNYTLVPNESAVVFLSEPKKLANSLAKVINSITGINAKFSTSGGTSDARFIYKHCEVAEFGLQNATAHKIDEHIMLEDLAKLKDIYYNLILEYFEN
jgi:succinyl-diaminopimelate desuccinylase